MAAILPVLVLAACAQRSPPGGIQTAAENVPGQYAPGIELPEGEGVELVRAACTGCHDLAGLRAYQGYWNEARWRSMVTTMVRNGAELDAEQAASVTAYLTRYFGPGTRRAIIDQQAE